MFDPEIVAHLLIITNLLDLMGFIVYMDNVGNLMII
jgi:hypothetical protein